MQKLQNIPMRGASLPVGVKRTVLDLLLRRERTAEEIAAAIGVTATAVRQHLGTLLGLGLLDRRKAGTQGGRPAFVYRLNEAGRDAYPKRHDLLSRELVASLLEREGRERTLAVVTDAARRLADANRARFEHLAPGARWDAVLAWLEEELAWEAEAPAANGSRRIVLHQCPFRAVSAEHPAVCGAFLATLVERLTGVGPFAHRPIGDGLVCCALVLERGRDRDLDESLL